MKKESNEKRILRFLWEQQFPDDAAVGGTPHVVVDHVQKVALETCRCVHLQDHLPHLLDLSLCRTVQHPRRWFVTNPVHSLHMSSQLDDTLSILDYDQQPPLLYGEEQQRTMILNTEGMVEYWCPLNGSSAAVLETAVESTRTVPIHSSLKAAEPPPPTVHSSPVPSTGVNPAVTMKTTMESSMASPPGEDPTGLSQGGEEGVTHSGDTATPPTMTILPDEPTHQDPMDTTETATATTTTDKKGGSTVHHPNGSVRMDPLVSPPSSNDDDGNIPAEKSAVETATTREETSTMSIDSLLPPKMMDAPKSVKEELDMEITTAVTSTRIPGGMSPMDTSTKIIEEKKGGQEPFVSDLEAAKTLQPVTVQSLDSDSIPLLSTSGVKSTSISVIPTPGMTPSLVEEDRKNLVPLEFPEEETFSHLRLEEERIRLIRRTVASSRVLLKKKGDAKTSSVEAKKKRKRDDFFQFSGISGSNTSNLKELTTSQEKQWHEARQASKIKVEGWMDKFRTCREAFWDERQRQPLPVTNAKEGGFYLPQEHRAPNTIRSCQACSAGGQGNNKYWDGKAGKPKRQFSGDDIMQCLECDFVGCSPQSMCHDSKQHILQHLLISGHTFAVSCGERCQLFCFSCGDAVYHKVFEQEKARIDCGRKIPSMAWKPHQVYRSFDPFQFIKTQDHGIVWQGLIATYPQLVPQEHIRATEAICRRQALFSGEVQEKCLTNCPAALTFAAVQSLGDNSDRQLPVIKSPVGMYNLGNTCYKSSVLQCLVHCLPLQQFFLKNDGHNHHACKLYRQWDFATRKKKRGLDESICLACEMDRMYLAYYGNTIGMDVQGAVEEVCNMESMSSELNQPIEKGDPLVISEMLTASWKSGGMNSLASYKQHDSHEFLNSFLEQVGKQTRQHWGRVHAAMNYVQTNNSQLETPDNSKNDIVKSLFEGSLSSVLLCEECGTKRKRSEEFLNVSLSLSEEVARRQSFPAASKSGDLSVETCLERFVMAERLGDSVSCPSCGRKTTTHKQHTFGRLPKVLCLHLKRFDASQNKKIDDYVSFPARGLNMGRFLAQWCEVSSLSPNDECLGTEPQINYDLFGTVNHVGNMSSGHYVANVKVGSRWYRFNDAHVSLAGGDGGVDTVVKNAGAYILFYVRR